MYRDLGAQRFFCNFCLCTAWRRTACSLFFCPAFLPALCKDSCCETCTLQSLVLKDMMKKNYTSGTPNQERQFFRTDFKQFLSNFKAKWKRTQHTKHTAFQANLKASCGAAPRQAFKKAMNKQSWKWEKQQKQNTIKVMTNAKGQIRNQNKKQKQK